MKTMIKYFFVFAIAATTFLKADYEVDSGKIYTRYMFGMNKKQNALADEWGHCYGIAFGYEFSDQIKGINPHIEAEFYHRPNYAKDGFERYDSSADSVTINVGVHYNDTPYARPYTSFGIGSALHEIMIVDSIAVKSSRAKLAYTARAGIQFPIKDNHHVCLEYKYLGSPDVPHNHGIHLALQQYF